MTYRPAAQGYAALQATQVRHKVQRRSQPVHLTEHTEGTEKITKTKNLILAQRRRGAKKIKNKNLAALRA